LRPFESARVARPYNSGLTLVGFYNGCVRTVIASGYSARPHVSSETPTPQRIRRRWNGELARTGWGSRRLHLRDTPSNNRLQN